MKTRNVCKPIEKPLFNAGGALILLSSLIMIIFNVKSIFIQFADGGSFADLILYVLLAAAALMLYFNNEYKLAFISLVLFLATKHIGLSAIVQIACLALLLSAIGFKGNGPVKFMKKVRAPWLCVLAFLLVVIQFVLELKNWIALIFDVRNFAISIPMMCRDVFLLIGIALILISTESVPAGDAPFVNAKIVGANKLYKTGVILLVLNYILRLLPDISDVLDSFLYDLDEGILGGAVSLITLAVPYLAAIFAFYFMLSHKNRQNLWAGYLLLYLCGWGISGAGLLAKMTFFILISNCIGFLGNTVINDKPDSDRGLTIADLILIGALILALIQGIIKFYRFITTYEFDDNFEFMDFYLDVFGRFHILEQFAMLLVIIGSENASVQETVVTKCGRLLIGLADLRKNFYNDVGGSIQKLAKAFGLVFVFFMQIAITIFLILAVRPFIGTDVDFEIAPMLILAGIALSLFLTAASTWFVYAFGQITFDIRKQANMEGKTIVIDYGKEKDEISDK